MTDPSERQRRLEAIRRDRKAPDKVTKATPPREGDTSFQAFQAIYEGTCADCGGQIRIGQFIRRSDGWYVHAHGCDEP